MKAFPRFPDEIIGPEHDPHFVRWYLFRSERLAWLPRLYLHRFYRSDDDRAPHNHPWWFVSLLLRGSYIEHRWIDGVEQVNRRRAGSIAFRGLSTRHRVELEYERVYLPGRSDIWTARPKPVWSLILTGPKVRGWGFFCPKGYVPRQQFDIEGCGE